MKRWLIAVALVGCGGSSSLSSKAAALHEGNDADLQDCTFLGKVEGTAGDNDKSAELHSKNMAREAAVKLGATHLKWIIPCCHSVEAEAYKCDLPGD
jgi:hypothetical protein